MKKILITLCTICLIIPFGFCLSGCKEQPPAPQITIAQIYDAFEESELPTVEGVENLGYRYNYQIDTAILSWQRTFERNNIDTTDFMAMDYYEYLNIDDGHDDYGVYIFKFSNQEAATSCNDNFNFTDHFNKEYISKTYGNLVVAVRSEISNFAFGIIDNLTAE